MSSINIRLLAVLIRHYLTLKCSNSSLAGATRFAPGLALINLALRMLIPKLGIPTRRAMR